jgi:CheY-like chemotaxis protein
MEIMLQRRGFRVVGARDGVSAIDLFRQINFDAVILDYSMPGMSGGEVAREIRAENSSVPIILHTGYKEINDPLLENVTCTLPKGSLSFLVTKLRDVLNLPESTGAEPSDAEEPAGDETGQSVHVA